MSVFLSIARWTSALQLRGREFCFILNACVRDDRKEVVTPLAKVTRGINKLCVTAGGGAVAVHPPENVCLRGGGFDDRFRRCACSSSPFEL